ncbi:MAG: hypothetical protein WCK05_08775, partial [Planctomycetota bacterium]
QWLEEHADLKAVVTKVLPPGDKLERMAPRFIRSEFGPKLKDAAKELGVDLSDEVVAELFASLLANREEWPEEDIEELLRLVNYYM